MKYIRFLVSMIIFVLLLWFYTEFTVYCETPGQSQGLENYEEYQNYLIQLENMENQKYLDTKKALENMFSEIINSTAFIEYLKLNELYSAYYYNKLLLHKNFIQSFFNYISLVEILNTNNPNSV